MKRVKNNREENNALHISQKKKGSVSIYQKHITSIVCLLPRVNAQINSWILNAIFIEG